MALVCQTCHTDLYEGAQFCPRCGRYTDVGASNQAVEPAPPPHQAPQNQAPQNQAPQNQVTTPLPAEVVGVHPPALEPAPPQATHTTQREASNGEWRRWVLLPVAGVLLGSLVGVAAWGVGRLTTGDDEPTVATVACAEQSGAEVEIAGRRVAMFARSVSTDAPLLPTIIALDGDQGAPALIERYSSIGARLGTEDGAMLVVQPEGHPAFAANGERATAPDGLPLSSWDVSDAAAIAAGADPQRDVRYLEQLINNLVADHCADPARVMLTGLSTGGTAAIRTACMIDPEAGGFEGIKLVAAVRPLVLPQSVEPPAFGCSTVRELDIVVVSGAESATDAAAKVSVEDWFDDFTLATLGCSAPQRLVLEPGNTAPAPSECGAGRAVNLHIEDLGASWPGGEPPGFAYRPDRDQTLPDYIVERPELNPASFDFTAYVAQLHAAS